MARYMARGAAVVDAVQWLPSDNVTTEGQIRTSAFFRLMRANPEPKWHTEGIGSKCIVILDATGHEAHDGDWILRNAAGQVSIMTNELFKRKFRLLENVGE